MVSAKLYNVDLLISYMTRLLDQALAITKDLNSKSVDYILKLLIIDKSLIRSKYRIYFW